MTLQGINTSPLHGHTVAESSAQGAAAASTPRQPAVPARASTQALMSPDQARTAAPRSDTPKVTNAVRKRVADLAQKFRSGEAPLLELFAEQMAMEGELLSVHPSMPYEDVTATLHEDLHAFHSGESAPMAASRKQAEAALAALGKQQGVPLDAAPIKQALDNHSQALAEHLAVGHSRYEEVLGQPGLSAGQRGKIERSHAAFVDHAIRLGTEVPRMLERCANKTESSLELAKIELADSGTLVSGLSAGDELDQATAVHGWLQESTANMSAVHEFVTKVKDGYKAPEAFADALHNTRLPGILADFDKQRSAMNIFRTVAPAAVAQSLASALHFGATRSSIERGLSDRSFATRVSAAGTGLGVAHELVNNSVRPAAQEILGAMGGMTVRPVKPSEVIAKPMGVITVKGVRHQRSKEEFESAVKVLKDVETAFLLEQNKHKFGTIQGEGAGFGSFGTAQTLLEGIVASGLLPEKTIPALMLTSALGGGGMASIQTLGQLKATVKDPQGRDLPTHVPKAVSGTLGGRLAKVGNDGKKTVDIRQNSVQEAFLSKIMGSIQGITVATAAADSVRNMPHDTPGHIATRLLVSALGPTLTLSSFFAAMQTKPEATKGGTGRLGNARNNLLNPDRDTLPHTTRADTTERVAENTFNRVRGGLQLPSQAAVEVTSAVAQLATDAVGATVSATANAGAAASRSFRNAMRGSSAANPAERDIELGEFNTGVHLA